MGAARKVVIVDEGASFGGSLVIASHVIRFLNSKRYAATLVCEVDSTILGERVARESVQAIRKNFNYVDRLRYLQKFEGLTSSAARRFCTHAVSAYGFARNLEYRARLKRALIGMRADLIHTNNSREAIDVGKRISVPVIWHLHGLMSRDSARTDRSAIQYVSRLVAISKTVADSALRAGVPEEKLITLENPCIVPDPTQESSRAAARLRYGISDSAVVFGIVGRIVPWKGQREFLAAAESVLERDERAVAVIVGDASEFGGEYERAIQTLAAQSKYRSRIIFTGFVHDVRPIYEMLDVVVHCSTDPEPFGLVITEAMAHEVVVVAASLGAPTEIITDGVDGYLVDPRDSGSLSDRIAMLLTDDEARRRVTDSALQMVKARFDPKTYCDRLASVYDAVLDRHNADVARNLS